MINNITVENKHTTTSTLATVYPITFEGATDAGGYPLLKVTITDSEGAVQNLVYNIDYALVYDDNQEDNDESLNEPHLNGIKFLREELAVPGNLLTITRTTPFVQPIDFQVGRIDPEQVERVADLSVLRDQELRNQMTKDETVIEDHESRIAEAEAVIEDHESRIAEAEDTIEDHESRISTAEESIDTIDNTLSGHLNNLNNPHQTTVSKLKDVAITNLQINQFLAFDGTKWKNVNYSAVYAWGGITGNIADQADLKDALDTKVNIDGTSIMTAPLKFTAGSMRGAVGPYLNGVSFWKMDSQGSLTNIANLTDNQFYPVTTNAINLGRSANTWKDLYLGGKAYVATINNGADLSVPNKSGTLATTADVELAARSGRMLTDQGVWYAKMYSATVAPAAENGTNYADFSQVDSDNNPIIVIYTRTSGAWVQSEIITPPADYDGYVPVTSKIWDIAEQSGQQGGRVLWNHTSKEFTPYPTIISFEDIEITGDSTVIMPNNPINTQIANKKYVDDAVAEAASQAGYHPDLFDVKWADYICNDVQWLRADTFSWQSGAVYESAYDHLVDDIDGKTLQSETIAGTTIQFYLADDGHKICPASQESNVSAIYNATGVAWYYIIDTTNQRFKLPRTKFGFTGIRSGVGGFVEAGLPNITGDGLHEIQGNMAQPSGDTNAFYPYNVVSGSNTSYSSGSYQHYDISFDASRSSSVYGNSNTVQPKATEMYLYFYVGNFTQTAIENTAGLNASLFNNKADIDAGNFSTAGKKTLSGFGMPSNVFNDLTFGTSGSTYTAPENGYFYLESLLPSGAYMNIRVYDENDVFLYAVTTHATNAGYNQADIVPIKKGYHILIVYNNVSSVNYFRFIYADGAAS